MSNLSTTEMLILLTAPQAPLRVGDDKGPKWVVPVVVAALVVGLGWSWGRRLCGWRRRWPRHLVPKGTLAKPELSVRRANRECPESKGTTGPAGALAATSIVASTALKSAPDPGVGTVLVAKTTCPAGKILLSGGAQVSAPGVLADRNVELRSSFPFSTTQWQTVAIVTWTDLGTVEDPGLPARDWR